jgi:predicted Zn-dependent protease
MSEPGGADHAMRLADRLRGRDLGPWDVYAESLERYEVHLRGARVELVRGPIRLAGYGLRLLRPSEGQTRVGFAAASDASEVGLARTLEAAEAAGRFARFPAPSISLPTGKGEGAPPVESVDRALWEDPQGRLDRAVAALLGPLEGRTGLAPSFGSVRATLARVSLANSEGAERSYARTQVDLEFAVTSSGGPEGAPPGEYWVNQSMARLDPAALGPQVERWGENAVEVRRARPTPSGLQTVLVPPEVLAEFLPEIVGYRLGGAAELRGMMPAPGTEVGPAGLSVADDGLYPYGLATAPWDDEGTAQARRHLVRAGKVAEPLYDLLYGSALHHASSGSGRRGSTSYAPWFRFVLPPGPSPATVVVEPGSGGRVEELAEAIGDGLWVDQLGYAFPDPISSAFGGEVRLGWRIRGGRKAEPVRGGTVGSVLFAPEGTPTFLRSVRAIGNVRTLVGRLSAPALVVADVSVAGGG